jgi:hypothetical protein
MSVKGGVHQNQEKIAIRGNDVTVDHKLTISGIYGINGLSLHRPGCRQVEYFGKNYGRAGRNLYCDQICHPDTGKQACHPDTVLFDQGFAVRTGGNKVEAKSLRTGNDDLKAVKIKGDDGITYVLAVNFGISEISNIKCPGLESITLAPLETILIKQP